jgi:hypothetical protein
MADVARIISAIKILAEEPDGSLNLSDTKVSVRKAQKFARASTNDVGPILSHLRSELGIRPTREALNNVAQKLISTSAPSTTAAVDAETATGAATLDLTGRPTSRRTKSSCDVTHDHGKNSAGDTAVEISTTRLVPELPEQAGTDLADVVAMLTEKVDGLLQLFAHIPSLPQTSPKFKPLHISSADKHSDRPSHESLVAVRSTALGAQPDDDRGQVGRAAEGLLRVEGPLVGVQIYNALDQQLKERFRPHQIQELLRWSEANQNILYRLPDGRWWLKGEPIFITRRRQPSEEAKKKRNEFAALAVELIRKQNRPFGAVELYDAIPLIQSKFVRACSTDVLTAANNPNLLKLRDGSWWLADRDVPPMPPRERYHSRVRADYYDELGNAVIFVLRTKGSAMKGADIRQALPLDIFKKIEKRNIHELLVRTQRDYPLICLPERMWWIEGERETTERIESRQDKLARSTIEILRKNKSPMKASWIRAMLPDELKEAYPSIVEPLRKIQPRYPELVLNDNNTWSLVSLYADSSK